MSGLVTVFEAPPVASMPAAEPDMLNVFSVGYACALVGKDEGRRQCALALLP